MPITSDSNGRGRSAANSQQAQSGYQQVQDEDHDHDEPGYEGESAGLLDPEQPNESQAPAHFTWPKRNRSCLVYGLYCLLAALLVGILAANLIMFMVRSTYDFKPTPDVVSPFCKPDKLPKPGEDPLPYPSDLLRDVIVKPIHSHNDYWRKVPVCTALSYGAISIEADVWLQPDGEVLVGHDTWSLRSDRTFRSLYLNPLTAILTSANVNRGFHDGSDKEPHGVFDTDPEQTLTLLVDVKTSGPETFQRVLEQIEPLRERGWLSTFEKGRTPEVKYGRITVIMSGNTQFESVIANETHRHVFFDAPLGRLDQVPAGWEYNNTNSYWASASIKEVLKANMRNLASGEKEALEELRKQIKDAHKQIMDVRYWDIPQWPVGLRNKLWEVLKNEGVDYLNVDDLKAAAESDWSILTSG